MSNTKPKMPEMRKAFGLRNRACKGSNVNAATASGREADCYLHGVFPEEEIVNGSNWLEKSDRRIF